MSVQQEHLSMKQASISEQENGAESQAEQTPRLEFSVQEADESLEAYISAISGAVLGVLATLLILYILNGGTLRFTDSSQVEALEASLTRVDENVGAVNQNLDLVAQRLAALESEGGAISQMQTSLADLDANLAQLDATLAEQGVHLNELDQAVSTLDVTRQKFDTFTAALVKALGDMGEIPTQKPAPESTAPAPESAAPAVEAAPEEATAVEGMAPVDSGISLASTVVASGDVAPDALRVVLFVDGNGNGSFDEGETPLSGAAVTLTPAEGEALGAETDAAGAALFEGLAPGEYTAVVSSVPGLALAGENAAPVTVDGESAAGYIVFFAAPAGQ